MYAEVSMQNEFLKEALEKKYPGHPSVGRNNLVSRFNDLSRDGDGLIELATGAVYNQNRRALSG